MRDLVIAILFLVVPAFVEAAHPLVVQGNGKLAKVNAAGEIDWEMSWGGIHDVHVLKNGNIMVQKQMDVMNNL